MAQTQVPNTCPVCGEKVKEGEACIFMAPVTTTGRHMVWDPWSVSYKNKVKVGHLRVLLLGGKKNKHLIHLECWVRRVSWR